MQVKATTTFRNSGGDGPYGNKAWREGEQLEVVAGDALIADNMKAGYLVEVKQAPTVPEKTTRAGK